jgi:hypothetical protein
MSDNGLAETANGDVQVLVPDGAATSTTSVPLGNKKIVQVLTAGNVKFTKGGADIIPFFNVPEGWTFSPRLAKYDTLVLQNNSTVVWTEGS